MTIKEGKRRRLNRSARGRRKERRKMREGKRQKRNREGQKTRNKGKWLRSRGMRNGGGRANKHEKRVLKYGGEEGGRGGERTRIKG